MDIWVRPESTMFHSVVITIVGKENYANIEVSGHLRDQDEQHFVIRHHQRCDWLEDQETGTDWLRDALIEFAERL
jgi:hypothetical protein